jgi:hypothetical protein
MGGPGRMELHLKSFPLVPLIDDVAKTIESMVTNNGNRIEGPPAAERAREDCV